MTDLVAEAEADLAERRRLHQQALDDQIASEQKLAEQRAAQRLQEQIEFLRAYGVELDGPSSKVQQLGEQLVKLDALYDPARPKAFAAAQTQIVAELVAQAGGLERLEQLYRDGLVSAEAWNQALAIAAGTSAVLATNIGRTSDGLERQTAIVDTQTGALYRLAEAATIAGQGMVALGAATGATFDEIARSQGRAAAIDEAVSQGGRLVLGGTRVIVPRSMGGGSRLVRSPGLSSAMRS